MAGPSGLAYGAIVGLVAAAGLPLGFALFGRRHAGGWIAGALFGYAAVSIAWWAVVFAGMASTLSFVVAWAATGLLTAAAAGRLSTPAVDLPVWTRRDTAALLFVLLLVPVLVWKPFANIGKTDPSGARQYRAYFLADFVWHTAVTAELEKEAPRPVNPFLAPEPIHYYWTYFRIPATLAAHGGYDVEDALRLNATGVALLLLAAVYLAAWTALPRYPAVVAAAVALTVLAPSAEGLAAITDLVRRGQPLADLRDLNIDAVAAWAFKGLRVDDLPRAMWYTPQHSLSYALGLLSVPVAIAGGVGARTPAILLAGLALGASLTINPLVGAAFCGVYGVAVPIDAVWRRSSVRAVLRHSLAAVPVLVAYGWCALNQVGDGAGEAVRIGFTGLARNGTVMVFLLSFGPLLLLIGPGLWPSATEPFGRLWPAACGVGFGLVLLYLVSLSVDPAWVGFRGGHIVLVAAPAIVARGLLVLGRRNRRLAVAAAAVVLATGIPTTAIDAYNAQDVSNRHRCCGPDPVDFHWTVVVTAGEQQALGWIRTNTPRDAVVQMEPIVRARETWSLIPSFARRRMATGSPIALLVGPEYEDKNALVQQIYQTADAANAWETARAMGIDYVYVGAAERGAYPNVVKFDQHPEYFDRVFGNADAAVYAVE